AMRGGGRRSRRRGRRTLGALSDGGRAARQRVGRNRRGQPGRAVRGCLRPIGARRAFKALAYLRAHLLQELGGPAQGFHLLGKSEADLAPAERGIVIEAAAR